jgi:hypothetical protein
MFVILSSLASSLLFSNCVRNRDMFLGFGTLAAAMGIVFENSERSRTALAERTIGGLKRDMASDEGAKLSSYKCIISKLWRGIEEATDRHGCIMI